MHTCGKNGQSYKTNMRNKPGIYLLFVMFELDDECKFIKNETILIVIK